MSDRVFACLCATVGLGGAAAFAWADGRPLAALAAAALWLGCCCHALRGSRGGTAGPDDVEAL